MNTEKEFQLESMSFRDMASMLLPTTELDALMTALEEQGNLTSEQEESASISLMESFESLRTHDPKLGFVFVKEIANIITSKALRPEDIPKLVHSINFSPEALSQTQEKYRMQGTMSWRNFGINVHSDALKKNSNGTNFYNLGHMFSHEISHSIIESGAITLDKIEEILEGANINYESDHVMAVANNENSDPELLLKERFCEISGAFLQSASDADPAESFVAKMIRNSSSENIVANAEAAEDMIKNYKMLYERVSAAWPSISSSIGNSSFEEIYEMAHSNQALEFDTTEMPSNEQISRQSNAGDSGSESLGDKLTQNRFDETKELGRSDQSKGETFYKTTQYLLRDFAEELNPF